MRRLVPLLAFAFPLPSPAAAQEAPPAPPCRVDGNLPAELATWPAPAPAEGVLRPGTTVQVRLRPIGGMPAAVAPHQARIGATTGARLELEIAAAGTYQIALGGSAWIDLVRDGQAVPAAAHGHGPSCSSILKTVDFPLSPGRYAIQLSGTSLPAVRLLVIPR